MDYLYGKLCKYIEEKSYTLPVANSNTLGGIKADPRTENDTQEVKIDTTSGKLYTTSKTQSDWSASDADSPAYIKNKPTIPSLDGYATEQYVDNSIDRINAIKFTEQTLTDEQKAQARENIGAVGKTYVDDSVASAIAGNLGAPVARALSADGIAYTATGDDLPTVSVADNRAQISAVGKGRQIVFMPDTQNTSVVPTLKINGGEVIPIRLRAPCNQGTDDVTPDATIPVPVGALMRGVPYTMTFCGKYWLIDSLIDLHTDSVTEADVETMIANAIGDAAGALVAMDHVIGGAGA